MRRTILHLDMNSYYASVEQQANVLLRDKCLGVTKGEGRSCLIAVSTEAKRYGVKTGMSLREARVICPRIIVIGADMDKYLAVTRKLLVILGRFCSRIEVFSIDEVFADITMEKQLYAGGELELTIAIKDALRVELGEWLTCSVGISYNKILAKLASEMMKPDGLYIVDESNLDTVLGRAEVEDMCGIGRATGEKLRGLGINKVIGIRSWGKENLRREFGDYRAEFLWDMAWGRGDDRIVPTSETAEQKSVSRTYTTFSPLYAAREIAGLFRNISEEVGWKLRQLGKVGRTYGLSVRGREITAIRRLTLGVGTDDGGEIFRIVTRLYARMNQGTGVRFVGVFVSSLAEGRKIVDQSLFGEARRKQVINKVSDTINARYGGFTLIPGSMVGGEILHREPNGYLGDKRLWEDV